MNKRQLVLITCDDGYTEGFKTLMAIAQERWGKACVKAVMPFGDHSGMGSACTLSRSICVFGTRTDNVAELGVAGFPLDCVRYGIWKYKPTLVLVGVNRGANLGLNLISSSTFCCAALAAEHGIPAIAFSQHVDGEGEKHASSEIHITEALDACFDLHKMLCNVNLHNVEKQYRGIKFAYDNTGRGGYLDVISEKDGLVSIQREFKVVDQLDRWLVGGYTVIQSW